jgi:hypothetical protein
MRLAIKRSAQAATIAAAIVASSGSLQATGHSLFAILGEVAFNLRAAFTEVEEVRRKITEAQVVATGGRMVVRALTNRLD